MKRQYREFLNEVQSTPSIAPFASIFEAIFDEDLEDMNDQTLTTIQEMLDETLAAQKNVITSEIINSLDRTGISKEQAKQNKLAFVAEVNRISEKITDEPYHSLIKQICDIVISFTDQAIDQYHSYNFILPIKLEEGAQVPTYAHESDAAADLYAKEDITLPAHSLGNLIDTGVRIALPENWMAVVVPRSSIGLKTGLRLSNSTAIIDPMYRGTIGVIYDCISDSDYTIHKGDRIAQLYLLPVYRFKAQVVDELDETERGDKGYGSTGK